MSDPATFGMMDDLRRQLAELQDKYSALAEEVGAIESVKIRRCDASRLADQRRYREVSRMPEPGRSKVLAGMSHAERDRVLKAAGSEAPSLVGATTPAALRDELRSMLTPMQRAILSVDQLDELPAWVWLQMRPNKSWSRGNPIAVTAEQSSALIHAGLGERMRGPGRFVPYSFSTGERVGVIASAVEALRCDPEVAAALDAGDLIAEPFTPEQNREWAINAALAAGGM